MQFIGRLSQQPALCSMLHDEWHVSAKAESIAESRDTIAMVEVPQASIGTNLLVLLKNGRALM